MIRTRWFGCWGDTNHRRRLSMRFQLPLLLLDIFRRDAHGRLRVWLLRRSLPVVVAGSLALALLMSGCGTSPGVTRLSSKTPSDKVKLPETVFLRSVVCQDCHPAEYEEWRAPWPRVLPHN